MKYYFTIADNQDLREKVFRFRYHVYCVENDWISSDRFAGTLEQDSYDERSIIYLVMGADGDVLGTTRLILNRDQSGLPVTDHPAIEQGVSVDNSCEISRMAIARSLRKGALSLGFMRLIYNYVTRPEQPMDYIYISVEKRFLDILNRLGFLFVPIGKGVLWYGDVLIPARMDIAALPENVRNTNTYFSDWLALDPFSMDAKESMLTFLKFGKRSKKAS